MGIFRSFSLSKGSGWKDSRAGLMGCGRCSCIGLHTQMGSPFWHLILCGYHLEILNSFILQCVFCKWRLMTAEQERGFGVLTHSRLICPGWDLASDSFTLGMALGGVGLQCIYRGSQGQEWTSWAELLVGPGCLRILFPCEYPHDQDNERLNTN